MFNSEPQEGFVKKRQFVPTFTFFIHVEICNFLLVEGGLFGAKIVRTAPYR